MSYGDTSFMCLVTSGSWTKLLLDKNKTEISFDSCLKNKIFRERVRVLFNKSADDGSINLIKVLHEYFITDLEN